MDNFDGNPFNDEMFEEDLVRVHGPEKSFSSPIFTPNSVRAQPNVVTSIQEEFTSPPIISKPPVDASQDVFSTLLKYEKEVRAEKKVKKILDKANKSKKTGSKESTPSLAGNVSNVEHNVLKTSGMSTSSTIVAEPVRSSSKMGPQISTEEIKQKAQQMVDLVKASQVVETKRLNISSTRQVGGMGTQTTNWATGKVIPNSSSSVTESTTSISGHKQSKKPKKVIRLAGGQSWEDPSLLNWDVNDYRLFCGDLGNDVTDEVLTRTFSRYPSFQMAKVIRDKRSNKTKGYGFVSFKDPSDFTKAIKEMDGNYVGSRPIKLRKSNWKDRNMDVVKQKQKMKQTMGYK